MGLIAGMAEGAGRAGVQALHTAQQQYGAEELAKMKIDAEKELQANMQDFHRGENALTRTHAETLQGKGFEHAAGMQERGFEHAEGMQENSFIHAEDMLAAQQKFTGGENKLNRELQERLHKETNAVARGHLGVAQAQLALAQNHVSLVPQADGSFMRLGADGQPKGSLTDLSGNVIFGTKDVAASTKILMEGNIKQMTALESEIKTSTDQEEKKMLRDKISFLQRSNEILASGGKMDSTPPPVQAPQAAVEALKKDPKLADQFDAKYGKGSAAKLLTAESSPEKSKGIIERTRGYGETLDALKPKPEKRPGVDLEEKDRMNYP